MTDTLIPEGFRKLDVPDSFVGLIGPLWFKVEGEKLRVGLPLEPRHGNPMGWAHGGLLVTVADMVMGVGSGHATGIRWPHPTVSLSTEFVRGAQARPVAGRHRAHRPAHHQLLLLQLRPGLRRRDRPGRLRRVQGAGCREDPRGDAGEGDGEVGVGHASALSTSPVIRGRPGGGEPQSWQ